MIDWPIALSTGILAHASHPRRRHRGRSQLAPIEEAAVRVGHVDGGGMREGVATEKFHKALPQGGIGVNLKRKMSVLI